jgi:hypothetical protein
MDNDTIARIVPQKCYDKSGEQFYNAHQELMAPQ